MNPFQYKGIDFCRWVQSQESEGANRANYIKKKYRDIRDINVAKKLSDLYSLENKSVSDEELALKIQYELYK